MNYLARLRSLEAPNAGTSATAKTDKGAFVSFVGSSGTPFLCDDREPAPNGGQPRQALLSYRCPDGFAPDRWERLRQGAVRFAEEWADKALRLGWTPEELFKVAEPFARADLQGAAWFIGESIVTAVTADTITLRTVSGATQRLYRRGRE